MRSQVNCLSEVAFEGALKQAAELDHYLETGGKPVGPLHGLPISLKDQFRVEGLEASVGYIGWLGRKDTRDSESTVVKILRDAGAVVYVKTNVPTSLMVRASLNDHDHYSGEQSAYRWPRLRPEISLTSMLNPGHRDEQ